MEAILCRSFSDKLTHLTEVEMPQCEADEVLIKVHYAGVNFPDTLIVQGKYQFQPELPFSPGQEVSGEIAAMGKNVQGFGRGDRVLASMTWGGFAEYAVARVQNVYLIPPEVGMNEASCMLETYATALHALKDRGDLSPGKHLLVLGASGGTGTAAIQLGRLFGAKVTAVASTTSKREFAKMNGAHETLSYEGDLKAKLKELGGVDVIFDPVGGDIAERCFRALNPGGKHLVVGFAAGKIPTIPFNLPLLKSASIVGVFWGNFWRNSPDANRRNVKMLLKWFAAKKLHVHITKEFELQDAQQALDELNQRNAMGKIVLKTKNAD